MEEIDIATITRRSIRGVFALASRTFFAQLISFAIGTLLLPLYLSPAVYGVFFVVSAFIAFLTYFSDIGLAAALVQKKESVTKDELVTSFTIQQVLVGSIVLISLAASPFIQKQYGLSAEGVLLFQGLVIAFFLSSLKTIPSILLERALLFQKLVIPQIVETLLFNGVALVCAMNGLGITSFTYAVVARGLGGLICIYIIAPWKVQFGFSLPVAKRLLAFGIPFQMNSFLALLKDDLLTLYLGKVLPLTQVGYIGFAQKWALAPLRLVMDNIIRITFPSFSRLQDKRDILGKAIEKSLFAATFLIFPALAGMVILLPSFITFIPKYMKWEPALLPLTFFALNAALASISTPLINALNAIGKIKTTLYCMVGWTIATWVLTPLGIYWYGYTGVAIASAVIGLSVFFVAALTKRFIPFSLQTATLPPLFATIGMGLVLFVLKPFIVTSLVGCFLMVGLGGIVYIGVICLFAYEQVAQDIRMIIQHIRK